MRRLLSLALAISAMSTAGVALTPGVAHAGYGCGPMVGTEPQTIGVAGKTVHVPGVKARYCETWSGDGNITHVPSWVTPRIVPGTCDPSMYDPVCLTVFLDTNPLMYSNWTVETYIDGVAQPPISVDIPQYVTWGTECVLSVGYRTAPTHPCLVFYDMGQ
jgi:hypothetical protein